MCAVSQYPPPTGEVGTATPRRAAAASMDSCTKTCQLPARASVAVGSSKKVRCSPDFITIGCPSASVSFAGRIHVATTLLNDAESFVIPASRASSSS